MATKRKRSIINTLVLLANTLAVIPLLLVYASLFIPPDSFWPLAFVGLGYPYLVLVNIFFIAFWIFRFRLYFLLSLLSILICISCIRSLVQVNSTSKPLPEGGINLKVLSYNVRVFDLYNYGPNWELDFTNRNKIFRYLEMEDFDIIAFQEFVHDKSGAFKTIDTLPSFVRAKHIHASYPRSSKNINFFGVATLSAYPIVTKGEIVFPNNTGNICIFTDIKVKGDTIRIYNAHFESVGLSREDFVFMENIAQVAQRTNGDDLKEGSKRIMQRVKSAFIERSEQIRLVTSHIDACPYPVILMGDFNDTPHSWSYRQISSRLKDGFRAGKGFGKTYSMRIPHLRIDYIFHSNDFKAYNFGVGKQDYSDHYPVWVWLNLPNESTYE